jgi:hypothetical protein
MLDAKTQKKSFEIERGFDPKKIGWEMEKLSSGSPQKMLKVNNKFILLAEKLKKQLGLRGIKIRNLTTKNVK